MEEKVTLSIVIVSYGTSKLTKNCLESIIKYTSGVSYEIIVIDNNSEDDSVTMLHTFKNENKNTPVVIVENKSNVGFAHANNQGAKLAKGEYVLFLNSDTEINDNSLGKATSFIDIKPQVGIVGCNLYGVDGKLQESGGYFPTLMRVFSWMTVQDFPFVDTIIKPFHPLKAKSFSKNDNFFLNTQQFDWVIGAFLLIRKRILDEIKGWDKDYFMYTEDVDICYRTKQRGWEVWHLADVNIVHYGGASSDSREFPLISEYGGLKRFYKKYYPSWQYPLLRLFLKIGALGRMLVLGILEGRQSAKIYAKAFRQA